METAEEAKEKLLENISNLGKEARKLNEAYGLTKLKKIMEILDEIYADVDNVELKRAEE